VDIFDEEILKFWKALQNNEVKYIMIGGSGRKYVIAFEISPETMLQKTSRFFVRGI